ncbi:DUF6343 family protein [Frankia nepalensis]|uniref:DUF6343 family protein n=1 Tax=Frankia nepalensis TaxID=1836974 RepID=UPI001EE3FEA0|nr:DUF6343 family protein [Frankia nepalensis]
MLPPQRKPETRRRPVGRFAAVTGASPARSATRLRVALALFAVVFCGVVAGLFASAGWTLPAALLCLVGATAVVDLAVIGVRSRRGRRRARPSAAPGGAPGHRGNRSHLR